MTPDTIADIDLTILYWQRTGVDYCDAWWALGRRYPCLGGWPQVRNAMKDSARDRTVVKRAA